MIHVAWSVHVILELLTRVLERLDVSQHHQSTHHAPPSASIRVNV